MFLPFEQQQAEILLYHVDLADLHPLTEQLNAAGISRVQPLRDLQDIPLPSDGPVLLVLLAANLDPSLLVLCRRFSGLIEQGLLGLACVLEEDASGAALSTLQQAGCLDVQVQSHHRLGDDGLQRLALAARMVSERHLRLREQLNFRQKLAEQRVMEARLNYLADHDELTDLANRQAFERALGKVIEQGRHRQITHALLYLDLDRFKLHNDATGHEAGNALLRQLSNLLRQALPAEYLLARLGSDEFAVLLQATDEQEARRIAEQLRQMVATIEPDGREIVYHLGVSIGLSMILPGSIGAASQAMVQAEQACFMAKGRGGNCVHRFSMDDNALRDLHEDMHWASPIRTALAKDRLFLTYQPLLTLNTGMISHYEALVRIPAELGGNEKSAQFMLAAERLGLATQIDRWVIDSSIDFLRDNLAISLGVNLSSHAFQEPTLTDLIQQGLERTGIAPERLTFEITETAAIMNFSETRRMVDHIRELGCRFALDDFGSGFSSYHYLKHFPVDMLKIDGSFVSGMRNDLRDEAIVRSMIDIGRSLGKEVVAEFVEDADTLQRLDAMGIHHAQGYYIGMPTLEACVWKFDRDDWHKELQ
ncbi:MAG: EAL domain-containing protein [Chromatiales bacterium]|nr:EAL domain-containing protein [Chromatiales bacterium]